MLTVTEFLKKPYRKNDFLFFARENATGTLVKSFWNMITVHVIMKADGATGSAARYVLTAEEIEAAIAVAISNARTEEQRAAKNAELAADLQRRQLEEEKQYNQAEYFLVKIKFDWADEMTIEGFRATTKPEWESFRHDLTKLKFPYTYYIGSNEEQTWNTLNELMDIYKVIPIKEHVFETISELFPGGYGQWIELEDDDYDLLEDG